jgi:dsRNA-specific ribonuclease
LFQALQCYSCWQHAGSQPLSVHCKVTSSHPAHPARRSLTAGLLTVARREQVKNDRLADAMLASGLHPHIRMQSAALRRAINAASGAGRDGGASAGGGGSTPGWQDPTWLEVWAGDRTRAAAAGQLPAAGGQQAGDEGDAAAEAAAGKLPKALADVVEALMAAVWVDSGGDWDVAARVMRAAGLLQEPGR